MARLLLKFESQLIKEIPIGSRRLTIGRAPDSDIRIDNLAVSDRHARVYAEGDRLVLEDLGSLNGTYVNKARIERILLSDGDVVQIGKHQLQFDAAHDAASTGTDDDNRPPMRRAPAPKLTETAVLDTSDQRELALRLAADAVHAGSKTSTDGHQAPILRVLRGRTNRREYVLAGKLTVIGRSEMASVRLLGWFTPAVAAQINRREDGYYLGLGDRTPKINGQPITGPTRLTDGDIIAIGRARLQFSHAD